MTVRNLIRALLGLALLTCLPGCIITVGGSTRNPYERCSSGVDTCSGTVCQAANTTTTPGATVGGYFCSTSCVSSSDCPSDSLGYQVVCVAAGASSQCYRACNAGNTCPTGFTCGGPAGVAPFCVPNTTSTPACGASGQSCCSGSSCNSGLVCGTGGVCGVACGNSGQACCAGSTCTSGLACTSGTCSVPACGNVGQACCAGNTCTAPGAACGSDSLCGLAPYSACSSGSIGAACLGGLNTSSQVVATTCQRPMIANPGPNGVCTAACTGSMTQCPQWAGADRSYTYNCYLLQGGTAGQCFVDCPGGESCPAGTVCLMTPVMGGTDVRLCMPPLT